MVIGRKLATSGGGLAVTNWFSVRLQWHAIRGVETNLRRCRTVAGPDRVR
jgi:hypothetical protein